MMFISYILALFMVLSGIDPDGDNNGTIAGQIMDARNLQPLTGATIMIDGTDRGTATDREGNFLIENVPVGSYNLTIRFLGYRTVRRSNVIVNPNRTTTLEIRMEEELIEGEELEVRGDFFERPRDAIVSSHSMDFEEIRRSPGDLVDIQRAVQALPAVTSGSDQLNEIIVRGGNPGENLFVMDHIEIPNPNHFAVQGAGGGPINLLNSYMVREIDFYAGAFSARYGDKASSVMNITLRNGTGDRFRGEASMGMAGAGALFEGPISSNGSFIFSARRSYLDWIVPATGLTAIPNYYNTQGKLTFDLGSNQTLYINGVYGNDNINIEGGDQAGYGRGAENLDTKNSQYIAGATLRSLWSDRLFSFTTLSSVQNNYFVEVYDLPGRDIFFTNNSVETENTVKTDVTYLANKNIELSFGASFKDVNFQYDLVNEADTLFTYDQGQEDQVTGIYDIYPEYRVKVDVGSYKTSAYTQLTLDLLRSFRVTGGIRYDYFEYNDFSSLSPRLGFSYFLNSDTSLNLAYGRHFQSPAYNDLVANEANRNLDNKFTDQYVIGLEHIFREDLKFVVEGYYKEYDDVPVRRTLTTTDPLDFDDGTFLNAGSAEAKGIELFLQKKLINNFSGIVSYSYFESKAIDPRNNSTYNWDYDHRNMLTLISGYRVRFGGKDWYERMKSKWWFHTVSWLPFMPSDEFEISLKFRYLGGRPFTPPVYRPELREWIVDETQALNTERYPAYHRLDLRIDKWYSYRNWNFVIFFDLVNIYNNDNIWSYQYNDDGTVDEVLQFNTLPVGGVTIEF
ncbi:TonB-dependent receptor [Rhodohalobacter sp.]|uniref:TonB-dependent receptor n=1 Tax=Rhodohalobacter sp. TaxID=1974210 RepID=UPI002ACDE2BC|nr:TonB-dependent receptor [Rhodohalobacter sp.]MDZ7756787.1 TonB-dependent receptor [Rhodohalobacter sp.]